MDFVIKNWFKNGGQSTHIMMNSLKKFGKLIGIETGTSETNPNPVETPRSVAIFLY